MTVLRGFNRYVLAAAVLLWLAGLVVFSRAMLRQVNHDEHYFVTPGILLARQGLLPYQDYPYTHLPILVFVDALVASVTSRVLLGARLISAICSFAMLGLIFGWGLYLLRFERPWLRLLLAGGLVWLLVASPLFAYTSGLAWNHDWPVLMLVLAYLAHVSGSGRPNASRWNFAAGLLAALAVGARLSFVFGVIPFGISFLIYPHPDGWPGRRRLVLAFGAGFLVGMLPAFVLLLRAPGPFLFGNFGFFAIHAEYRQAVGSLERMDLATKLAFLFGRVLVLPGNFLLLFAWLTYGVIGTGIASWRAGRLHFDSLLAVLLVISLAASGLVPSPVFAQYFYDLAPFAVIGIALGLSRLLCWFSPSTRPARSAARLALVGSFVALVVVANVDSIPDYWQLRQVTQRSNWTPLQLHGLGYRIRQQVGSGRVFTLSPLYVLEGGLEIYPSMATGPFIWRTAALIPQAERQKYHVLAPQDLPALFAAQPPAAILVGEERELEISLVDYARQNGYTLTPVAESLRLWLKDPIKK